MTEKQRSEIARSRAKEIVKQLRASNEQAARRGGPAIAEGDYQGLESTLAQKLLRTA